MQRTRCAITLKGQQAASVSLHLHSRAAGWWAVLTSAVKPDFSTVGSFVGYSDFSRQDLCFLKVASGRQIQMTATHRSCALLFPLPEQSWAQWMWAPVGDPPCRKAWNSNYRSCVRLDALATCFSHDSFHTFSGITFCAWDTLPNKMSLALLALLGSWLTAQYFAMSARSKSIIIVIYFLLWASRYILFIWFCLGCELLVDSFLGLVSCGLLVRGQCCSSVNAYWHCDNSIWRLCF